MKAGSNCCLLPLKAPRGDNEAKREVTVCLAAAKGVSTETAGVTIQMKTGIFLQMDCCGLICNIILRYESKLDQTHHKNR